MTDANQQVDLGTNGFRLGQPFLPPLMDASSDDAIKCIRRVPASLEHGVLEYLLELKQRIRVGPLQNIPNGLQNAGIVLALDREFDGRHLSEADHLPEHPYREHPCGSD
ncbi:MAG TPA: hypothetical protein VN777_13595 [Terriglobales bacterium]|nr:hypothetical protein [Terriglobales bacterium]HZW92680.1 hypothetical protein [Candidatus Eremiobacteraceae bacterium]